MIVFLTLDCFYFHLVTDDKWAPMLPHGLESNISPLRSCTVGTSSLNPPSAFLTISNMSGRRASKESRKGRRSIVLRVRKLRNISKDL